MPEHASLLCIIIRATSFYLRTDNVYYAFMRRPTKRHVSTLYLYNIERAPCLIIPTRKGLAHKYVKNEHKHVREANNANYELA